MNKKSHRKLAVFLALVVMLQFTVFSSSGFWTGQTFANEESSDAVVSEEIVSEEAEAAQDTAPDAAVPQDTAPQAEPEKKVPAEEPAGDLSDKVEAGQTAAAPAKTEKAAAPKASNPTINVSFHIMVLGNDGNYKQARAVNRSVSDGGTTSAISQTNLDNWNTAKDVSVGNTRYIYNKQWKDKETGGDVVTVPVTLAYADAALLDEDGDNKTDYYLYAQYDAHTPITVNLHFEDIRHADGSITTADTDNTLSYRDGWTINKNKFSSNTGLTVGDKISYAGYEYTYTGEWTDGEGNKIDAGKTLTFYNREGETAGNTYYLSEDTEFTFTPTYTARMIQGLDYQYEDNISTGSGSWSNADAYAYRSEFGSLTHTFKDPSAASPVAHYQFKYWQGDHHTIASPGQAPVTVDDSNVRYNAGQSFTYTVFSNYPEGTVTTYVINAMWQPSVTVRWHDVDGTLVKEEESFEAGIEAYSYVPDDITVGTGDDTATLTFEGWYDADGNKVSDPTTYALPAITKNPVEQSITDLYPRYVTTKTVTKEWADENDRDGKRPEQIQMQLLADGEAVGDPVSVSINEDNEWTYTWTGLTAHDASGKVIDYTVEETVPEGYIADAVRTILKDTITNTHEPERIDIQVTKVWQDQNDRYDRRPASIKVTLTANGKTVKTVSITKSSNWKYTFKDLYKYENGKEITYRISEERVRDYSSRITGSAAKGFTVTNTSTYEPTADPVDPDDPDDPVVPIVPGTVTPGGNGPTDPTGTTITDDPAPRTGPTDPITVIDPPAPKAGGYWALINLICTILTAVLSLVMLALYFTRRKHQEDEEDDGTETETTIRKKGIARVLSLIPAIGSIVLFLLTEDMRLPMQLIDKWTIWMAIILLVNVVLAVISKKRKDEDAEDEEEPEMGPGGAARQMAR